MTAHVRPESTLNRDAAFRFLSTAYEADDWIAIFLKTYDSGRILQRVAPVAIWRQARWQTWLRAMNVYRFNVYVSVNAIQRGRRQRTRAAIAAIRHVFLDADIRADELLGQLERRPDLPPVSYVLHSSPDRVHVLWRVSGFALDAAERLQKHLARELGTDLAATSASQTTRLPGFFNHKYRPAQPVTLEYKSPAVWSPKDFPIPGPVTSWPESPRPAVVTSSGRSNPYQRARRYVGALPPAIAGQHGDLHTFRICCRLARGFALDDEEALSLLADWNARCQPPWSEHDLIEKLRRARQYGREPFGGLLETQP